MEKKNVIYWIGIKDQRNAKKYGNFEYFNYSKDTWKHFCKRFNCHFVEINELVEKDTIRYRPNWQKNIYIFDELEKRKIKYDQICLVDSTCMYKWNGPNFFELTDRKFVGWCDRSNMRWIYDSIQGYKKFFNGFALDQDKYINSGFIIFNGIHKEFFQSFKKLYEDNIDTFVDLQDNIVKKGCDQTVLNYWLQINNIDFRTDLSPGFKMTHLHRSQFFGHNWQLNEDSTPFFIKYGWNWIFNGIPKNERPRVMKSVWELVKHYYE